MPLKAFYWIPLHPSEMCYFGTGLLWSVPHCNLKARPVYCRKGVRRGRCVHLTAAMGMQEKAPWAAWMQSKNKSPSFSEPQIIRKLFGFVLLLIPCCPSSFVCVPLDLKLCIDVGGRQVVGGKSTDVLIVAGSWLTGRWAVLRDAHSGDASVVLLWKYFL